jgi:hypothetical protein
MLLRKGSLIALTASMLVSTARADFDLRAPPESGAAHLVVYSDMKDGKPKLVWANLQVWVDGVSRGKVTPAAPFLLTKLNPGKHLLGIDYAGQVGARKMLELSDGQRVFIQFKRTSDQKGILNPTLRIQLAMEEKSENAALADLDAWERRYQRAGKRSNR